MNLYPRETRNRARPRATGPLRGNQAVTKTVAASLLVVGLGSGVAWAETPAAIAAESAVPGTLVGVLTDAAKAPVGRVTVTIHKEGGGIRSTVSATDGTYTFADLPPGKWTLDLQAKGLSEVKVGSTTVNANEATRYDVTVDRKEWQQMAGLPNAGSQVHPADGFLAKLTHAVAFVTTPSNEILLDAPAATAGAAPAQKVPDALLAPPPGPDNDTVTPFANAGDIGWMNGNTREKAPIFDTNFFTPEIRFDMNYLNSFNDPHDHTIVGSTEEFRSGEFQIEQVSFGGNFHWNNVQARFLSMLGLFAVTTPRNDASQSQGQWDLQGAYKYMSEANAGYHWDNIGHGFNIDMGIFVSYIGLFSYYNFDNWTYQPSFVSSNTPWFFNGLRIQYYVTQNLKIEPWIINGWQSYAKFNHDPGLGGQILWIPNNNLKLVFNSYTTGEDNLASGSGQPNNGGNPNADVGLPNPNAPYVNYAHVHRIHEDDSVLWKYYDASADPTATAHGGVTKMAMTLTADIGCEYGGGVTCTNGINKENFFGVMAYNRVWFDHDLFAVTLGGGFMNNPGRYLALLPPINGATAATGTPYFTENPGQKLFQWDTQLNLQYMPKDWITWWTEITFRHSSVPYWSGSGGVTPPLGNTGAPGSEVCNNGSIIGGDTCQGGEGGIWNPDLRTREIVAGAGVMVKF